MITRASGWLKSHICGKMRGSGENMLSVTFTFWWNYFLMQSLTYCSVFLNAFLHVNSTLHAFVWRNDLCLGQMHAAVRTCLSACGLMCICGKGKGGLHMTPLITSHQAVLHEYSVMDTVGFQTCVDWESNVLFKLRKNCENGQIWRPSAFMGACPPDEAHGGGIPLPHPFLTSPFPVSESLASKNFIVLWLTPLSQLYGNGTSSNKTICRISRPCTWKEKVASRHRFENWEGRIN